MLKHSLLFAAAATALASSAIAANPTFKKITLHRNFYAEGASYGDFDQDGNMDVVSGPYWFAGPDFKQRFEIYAPKHFLPDNGYSDNFVAYTHDFNGDGLVDYLVYGFPGADASVYLNPGKDKLRDKKTKWERKVVFDTVDNESPAFGDFDGDGKPEGIFHTTNDKYLPKSDKKGGALGYAKIDWADPLKPWTFQAITDRGGWARFTHGYGFGDVNGDGLNDILVHNMWLEQPKENKDQPWRQHPVLDAQGAQGKKLDFGKGGAQMYVYDVDGDGLNDVITSLEGHGYGLAWFKQSKSENDGIKFERKLILGARPEDNPQKIRFSQLHAVDLVDMNGDGLKDIVTGKRYLAHGSQGDAEPLAPRVLYWFELKRKDDKSVEWVGHQIDDDSGVGTQVATGDLNKDGTPDVIVGNKAGAFVFLSEKKQ